MQNRIKCFLFALVMSIRYLPFTSVKCSLFQFNKNSKDEREKEKILQLFYSPIIDTFATTVFFGSKNQKQFKRINLCKPYTWFTKESFDKNESTSYNYIQTITLNFSFTSAVAEQATETVFVDRKSITNFPFYLIDNSEYFTIRYGSLGLAHIFDNSSYSLIHQLYNQQYISKLSFGFQPTTKSNGYFYIGGLPSVTKNNTHTAYCKAKHNDINWSCSLTKVYFDHYYPHNNTNITHVFPNDNYSYFQSSESKIFAPKDFINYLSETLFKTLLEKQDCFYENAPQFGMIYCSFIQFNFSMVNFVFDSHSYKIDINDLFYCQNKRCEFDILSNKWNANSWIFGTSFLKHFSSEFDYEKHKISFYSPSEFAYVGVNHIKQSISILLMINSAILVLVLFYNVILWFMIKK